MKEVSSIAAFNTGRISTAYRIAVSFTVAKPIMLLLLIRALGRLRWICCC